MDVRTALCLKRNTKEEIRMKLWADAALESQRQTPPLLPGKDVDTSAADELLAAFDKTFPEPE